MLKHGILKNGLLNNDSVISIILNISEESVNNKRVVVNRFFMTSSEFRKIGVFSIQCKGEIHIERLVTTSFGIVYQPVP